MKKVVLLLILLCSGCTLDKNWNPVPAGFDVHFGVNVITSVHNEKGLDVQQLQNGEFSTKAKY